MYTYSLGSAEDLCLRSLIHEFGIASMCCLATTIASFHLFHDAVLCTIKQEYRRNFVWSELSRLAHRVRHARIEVRDG